MKQKIALLFTSLLLVGFGQAQVNEESYKKAVDLLNCKTVEITLPKENIQQYQQKCPCNSSDFVQINKFLTNLGKLDVTIALSYEVESLKKSFKENWKKEDVVTFLSENIFTDKKFLKIVAFADKRKGSNEFNKYKISLKTDLSNTLVENVQQTNVIVPANVDNLEQTIEDRITEFEKNLNKSFDSGFLGGIADYLILLGVLLGAIALLLGLKKQSGNDSELSNNIKSYVKRKIDDAIWNKSTSNNNVGSTEVRDANNRIRDLELQIEKIKQKLNTLTPVQSSKAQQTYQETKQQESISETFFLSTPNADGTFNESSVSSTYREGATIYRFMKNGNNKAKFQIDEKDASARLALQYPDRNIDPVCESINAFNQSKRIITLEQGEAELQNGKWVVNKKAKISYEG